MTELGQTLGECCWIPGPNRETNNQEQRAVPEGPVHVYEDTRGEWGWSLVNTNGEPSVRILAALAPIRTS